MEAARLAHDDGNVTASIAAHDAKAGAAKEDHGGAGSEHVKSIVFGGLDGIITTFAIIASVVGADYSIQVVVITGFSKLLGDSLAMGIGDAVSESAEHDHIRGEHAREGWEYDNYRKGEVDEMVEIYKSKGFSEEEATTVINTMTKKPEYRAYFLEHMCQQELGLTLPPDDKLMPVKAGFVMWLSFMFFGSLPLWPYCIFLGIHWGTVPDDWATDLPYPNPYQWDQFGISIAITVLCLFALGMLQGKILRQNMLKDGLSMTINGVIAAAVSYGVGYGLSEAIPCG